MLTKLKFVSTFPQRVVFGVVLSFERHQKVVINNLKLTTEKCIKNGSPYKIKLTEDQKSNTVLVGGEGARQKVHGRDNRSN